MKMKSFLLALAASALLASCAHAELRITIGGRTYTSRVLGSFEEYWVGSEKLGEARRLGNSIIFRDVKRNELATRAPLGDKHIYRNACDFLVGVQGQKARSSI